MPVIMVCLVGEQPLANLLPIRHIRPDTVILLHTDNGRIRAITDRLREAIESEYRVIPEELPAYDLLKARAKIESLLAPLLRSEIVFNVTGGTKIMALASVLLALDINAPMLYLQSEGKCSHLLRFEPREGKIQVSEPVRVDECVTAEQYVKVHLGAFCQDPASLDLPGGPFEHHVVTALREEGFDVLHGVRPSDLPNLDLDVVARLGNQVGVAETTVKRSDRKRKIEQLSTAAQRERLGTYTSRILILNDTLDENNQKLARDGNVAVIILKNSGDHGLAEGDREQLVRELRKELGAEP